MTQIRASFPLKNTYKAHAMKLLTTAVYRGPNIHALLPVIRVVLDMGNLLRESVPRLGREFRADLLTALPSLNEPELIDRLERDDRLYLDELLGLLALTLQKMGGSEVTFCRTRPLQGDEVEVIFAYDEEEVALEALELARSLLITLLPRDLRPTVEVEASTEAFVFATALDEFLNFAQEHALGPSTGALVKAAEVRGIPWLRLNDKSLIQLGHGRYQKRLQATITSETRHIAVELASDKEQTHRILRDLGLPVPQQRLVYSLRRCLRACEDIGYPVVIKPLDGNHGRGVSINLNSPEEVEIAYDKAKEHSDGVIIESYLEGVDHRLLVVNGKLVAAAKRVPGHVVGDGRSTIAELVAEVNRDPRRGVGHEKVLTQLKIDDEALRMLALKQYTPSSIPSSGEIVYLRGTANLSTGGTAIDVTDVIHPENIEMAERTIRAIGLDVGGVDFLTMDITESYREVGGGICEVNAAPGFRMHVAPSEGKPRDVAGAVIDMLFPPNSPRQIPIAAVTGTNGKTTTSRMVAHILKMAGHTVGLATTDGVYIDGRLSVAGDMTGPTSAQMILRDPSIDAAVLETARGGLLRAGMGFQMANVSACLNVTSDHLGMKGINTLEDLAKVKRIVVEVAQDAVMLNADDVHCLQMADHTRAKRIGYVTLNPTHPLVKEHINSGGLALVLEDGINGQMITLYDHGQHVPLLWSHLIPATLEGRAVHNAQNAMFAAGLAHSLGISLENIRQGLRTFDASFFQAPGRMNVYDEHPFTVMLDYAHNPAAVKTICHVVDRMDIQGRKILVMGAPGDRRDEDIREVAQIAAGHFDHFICRDDDDLRGRASGEVAHFIRDTLLATGIDRDCIEVILSETEANQRALTLAKAGDFILTLAEMVTRTWKQIIYYKPTSEQGRRRETARGESVELPSGLRFDDSQIVRDERGVRLMKTAGSER